MTTTNESFSDKIKSFLSNINIFKSNPTEEEDKARANLDKITADCNEKTKVAQQAVNDATAAKVAKEAAEKALQVTGGKSRRKGTRKSKGKKNKKTRRS